MGEERGAVLDLEVLALRLLPTTNHQNTIITNNTRFGRVTKRHLKLHLAKLSQLNFFKLLHNKGSTVN